MKTKKLSVKEHILITSKEVFRQFGLSKVTMDDIAKASGKGRSTLYYYYKNKMEVFHDIVKEEFLDVIIPASNEVKPSNSLSKNLILYNRIKLERLQKKEQEYYDLIKDLRDNKNLLAEVNGINVFKEYQIYKEMMLWGVENEEIPKMSEADLDFLIKTIVTAMSALEKEFFLFDAIEDLNNKLEWLVNLLVRGLQK